MKIALKDIITASSCYQKIKEEKFPLKTSFKLARLFKSLENEISIYENLARETFTKYCKKDEEGNPIITKTEQGEAISFNTPEEQKKCQEEISELDNNIVEIEDCYFTTNDFGEINISLDNLMGLLPFIKEQEQEIDD